MSDIFESKSQNDFFESRLPVSPENYRPNNLTSQKKITDSEAADLLKGWTTEIQQEADFRNRTASSTGVEFSSLENNLFYKMYKNGDLDDDDMYRIAFSKEIGSYLGVSTREIYGNYDAYWKWVSEDMSDRYALPKSRYEAVKDSVQIAKNLLPMGVMGLQLQGLDNGLAAARDEEQKKKLQDERDKLWKEIIAIRQAN
jgi:hypothetical protein